MREILKGMNDKRLSMDSTQIMHPDLQYCAQLPSWWPAKDDLEKMSVEERLRLQLKRTAEVLQTGIRDIMRAKNPAEVAKLSTSLTLWMAYHQTLKDTLEIFSQ
jgi:hypothetical protein